MAGVERAGSGLAGPRLAGDEIHDDELIACDRRSGRDAGRAHAEILACC